VGKELVLQINENQGKEKKVKSGPLKKDHAQAVKPEKEKEPCPREKFHEGISPGNGSAAVPALSLEEKEGKKRNKVPRLKLVPAFGAKGTASSNGDSPGEPVDQGIQEGTQDQAKKECQDGVNESQRISFHGRIILPFPAWILL
jgi:hypothetical protein